MARKKRVLILTADAGFGHRSAANAIAVAFEDLYPDDCQVEIINPLEDKRTPFFLRDAQSDYDKMVRNMPEVYKLGYDASDTAVTSTIMESALIVLLFEVIRDKLRYYDPDVVVSTYPLYQSPLEAVFTLLGHEIPFFTAITDLATVHHIWFNRAVDACLVPTEIVRDLALQYGLEEEQVRVTGIPVNPRYALDSRSREEIREALGWQVDLPTVLAVGSKRTDRLEATLNVLNHYGRPVQLAVVAGSDVELFSRLRAMAWHQPVHLYEFSQEVPLMMRAADCLVCKAGGLIVTEALAAGCPLMLVDVLPGQETGNAEYVVDGGAGEMAHTDTEVLEVFAHWMMDDCRLLRERGAVAAALGRPRAAYTIAEIVYEGLLHGHSRSKHIFSRRTLIEQLNRYKVKWSP